MADMNMMMAMLRGAFAALTDEQKREVLGDGYAPQTDLASTLADVTLDEVLEHSDIDSEDLIEQLEAEGCWVHSDIEDMAQAVRDDGKLVFDEDDTHEVERWAKDNGYVFFECKDEARRSLLNGDDGDKPVFDNASEAAQWVYYDLDEMAQAVSDNGKLVFDNASEAAQWVFENEDEVAVQGRSLPSLAHQAGHKLFVDGEGIVEYVRGAMDKGVFDDDKAILAHVRDVMGLLVFGSATTAAMWVFDHEERILDEGNSLSSLAEASEQSYLLCRDVEEYAKWMFESDKDLYDEGIDLSTLAHQQGLLLFRNPTEAANWVYEHHLQELISVARGQGHLLFEDQSEIIEYVSDTLGKVVVSRPYLRKLREDMTLLLDGTLGVLLEDANT